MNDLNIDRGRFLETSASIAKLSPCTHLIIPMCLANLRPPILSRPISLQYLLVQLRLLILLRTRSSIPLMWPDSLSNVRTRAPMLPTGVRCIMVLTLI